MNNITYTEAINHVRTFKDFYCLKAIAEQINMSPAYFRNVINERYGLKNLPEKNRAEFVKVVSELCSVRQLDCDGSQHGTIGEAIDLFYQSNNSDPEPF